ncbi:CCC motif membrane protein [Winogradskyella sp. UBA3174]|uniref:CCC motif membrane protein n=1 Tax=Winogradskyella sp. UBA3174 TaxID=1947785 RepID=UPI0025DF6389|nr:CCC motif membrane protein [Winogradskyella sp. UBA3174]|tara:strand:- start:80636 stop:80971 length:336 start_codon:yes stop_codon:yes gene_type:complete
MEQQKLNPTIVYVLSVLGILCCCVLGAGIIPSAIAYFIAKSNLQKANNDIDAYEITSVKGMNTARIVALVAVVINVLMIARMIYVISTVGWDEMTEQIMNAVEEAQQAQGQ